MGRGVRMLMCMYVDVFLPERERQNAERQNAERQNAERQNAELMVIN